MPLKKGTSDKTRQENIEEMIAAGHDPDQAVAAAYRQQREAAPAQAADAAPAFLYDRAVIADGVRATNDGYLACEARVARVGTQHYRGHEVGLNDRENVVLYRPPEEVFSLDAMHSLANKPVTLTHPKRMVDSKTWSKVAKGWSGSEVARDGDYVRVPLMLTDHAAIEAYHSGTRELSVGYTTDIDWSAGTAPNGEHYDGIQRQIRGNHHALVPAARGGTHLRFGDASKPRGDDDDGDAMEAVPAQDAYWLDDREFSAEERKRGAKEGWAKSNGSYPIRNTSDLKNAVSSWGRGGATASDKAWIKKRARALGATSMLPEDWGGAKDAAAIDAEEPEGEPTMVRMMVGGLPVDVADGASAEILQRFLAARDAGGDNFGGKKAPPFKKRNGNGDGDGDDDDDDKNGNGTKDQDAVAAEQEREKKERGYKDAIAAKDGEIAVLKKQLGDAEAVVDAKLADLEKVRDAARPFLPKDYVFGGKKPGQIRRDVVALAMGDARAIADWGDSQIEGAFMHVIAAPKPSGARAMADGMSAAMRQGAPLFNMPAMDHAAAVADAAKSRADYIERTMNAYKEPISHQRN